MKKQMINQLQIIYNNIRPYLKERGYSEDDIKLILQDYVVAEALGKSYIGLEKAQAIILTQKENKRKKLETKKHNNYVRIDAKGEFLALVMQHYLATALTIAKEKGSCIFLIKNARTSPIPAFYSYLASKENMIVFQTSYLPARVVIFPGTQQPFMGTNPFSLTVPLDNKDAFLFDSAISEMATAKMKSKETVFPFGGIKGFNLGVFSLLLAGLANQDDVNILEKNDYADRKEASFCYIFLHNPTLTSKRFKTQSQKLLEQLEIETGDIYKTPGSKYKKALEESQSILKKYL